MKIIDLLNKIANGEEVPKVHYCDNELYIGDDGFLKDRTGDNVEWWIDKKWLNKEVEILEEKKIPEKLSTWYSVLVTQSDEDNVEYANYNFSTMYEKINEICDYIKSKGE